MAMNLKFDQGETEYEVVPKGEHKAICYRVVDAGTAEEEYQGEKSNKHKIFLFWELPELKMQDGRPMSIFAQSRLLSTKRAICTKRRCLG